MQRIIPDMSQEFDAIYENGVLRPLKPIGLKENDVVKVSVTQSSGDDASHLAVGARQREILLSFVAKIESLSEPTVADGFSNRQHDREIYDEPR
jgi:predicted DNA-binding antitoxin AbrB/MazE fold protein